MTNKKNVYIECRDCLFSKVISINKNLELIPKNVINYFNCNCENFNQENVNWKITNALSDEYMLYKYIEFIKKNIKNENI